MKNVFNQSFCFFIFVSKTMCFYLKWCKKNSKSQVKKTVCETVSFGSTKLTKSTKNF